MTSAKKRRTSFVAAAALAAAMAASTAEVALAAGAYGGLREGAEIEPPRAYTALCQRRPSICPDRDLSRDLAGLRHNLGLRFGAAALQPAQVVLTAERQQQLVAVNQTVNGSIRPVNDHGPDLWSITGVAGDCEEYVLAKMNLLAGLGWPRSAMRITVVRDGQGFHAVLVVETDRGGFVLDNMVGHITTISDSPYEFVVAESVNRPGAWVRVAR